MDRLENGNLMSPSKNGDPKPKAKLEAGTNRRRNVFAPKTKTGCFTCRRRRIKCDEQRPICKRCVSARFDCEYPKLLSKKRPPVLVLQPSSSSQPAGTEHVGYETELFGCFRTFIVASLGGSFNHLFWRVDVPAAAQIHPSLWHSALAIAAIHHSARLQKARVRESGIKQLQRNVIRNHYYILALTHYNKSIRHVADLLGSRHLHSLTYMEKEMVIINNILYLGICSMLEDPIQQNSHNTNLFNFLEAVRFGEEDPSTHSGVARFEDLLSVVLAIDGSFDGNEKTPDREFRAWAVAIPKHYALQTITQAYLEILPVVYRRLAFSDTEILPSTGQAMEEILRQKRIRSFEAKLDAFEKGHRNLNQRDREAVEMMRLYMQCMNIRSEILGKTSREDAMEHDAKWIAVVDQIGDLQARTTPLDRPYSHEIAPITFAPSLGALLGTVAASAHNVDTRRKAVDLMKKWPFKENNTSSEEEAVGFEAMIDFGLRGPERTRPWQQAGLPILPTFENGSLESGIFDGCKGCECIYGRFICKDHKLGRYTPDMTSVPPRIGLLSMYERRHELPLTWYSLEYT
ncbi:hypothetical protein VHEMI08068 [[Torrubiella] hemipterigena]|uniref:Zn(2)-C6 fungal-type domain-containing protein n=1 Tax=[Torrubiella] hemipterigena TaxID=1531966 RepID=A0A0A1TCA4_9HYPO|nr:hypothetical protein VHEMI08068 [[Torrubiella] hemipterigena]